MAKKNLEKKKYYKNGNPELYAYFTDEQMRHFTDREKAMWTERSSEDEPPISEDVLNFQNKQVENMQDKLKKAEGKIAGLEAENDELIASNKALREEVNALKGQMSNAGVKTQMSNAGVKTQDIPSGDDEEAKKKILRDECKRLGIKFAWNSTVETLEKKLSDANNKE